MHSYKYRWTSGPHCSIAKLNIALNFTFSLLFSRWGHRLTQIIAVWCQKPSPAAPLCLKLLLILPSSTLCYDLFHHSVVCSLPLFDFNSLCCTSETLQSTVTQADKPAQTNIGKHAQMNRHPRTVCTQTRSRHACENAHGASSVVRWPRPFTVNFEKWIRRKQHAEAEIKQQHSTPWAILVCILPFPLKKSEKTAPKLILDIAFFYYSNCQDRLLNNAADCVLEKEKEISFNYRIM